MEQSAGLGAIRNLDYAVLLCDDIAAMRDFYTRILGFEVRHEIDGKWVELEIGAALLALRRRSRPYDGPAPDPDSASVQLAFRVSPDDVETALSQLAELGIEPLEPIADLDDFGHRVLFIADPEHNIIEIYAEI
ncbi:MAG: glyoxalase/bleomycin resistance/dioxygenase family protein [Actinomycetia bacterium]|nr:glyoxalase/bleomycin resistance/dioxygenase family protein [Actinomycetes bacterium]